MTYRGEVHGGVVVLERGVRLPEGAVVRIEVESPLPGERPGDHDALFQMGDLAVATGVADLATNIDHYLYDHPKATDDR
ncbi:MAG: hypothetical protein U0587_06270 [Candidatus Binatia bacterium]